MMYQLKITLAGIKPPIWRRVLVPSDFTLYDLHFVIQEAMGWENAHLHDFKIKQKRYAVRDPEERHLTQSLKLATSLGALAGECYALLNLGLLCDKLQQPVLAQEHYEKSLEHSRAIGDTRAEGAALANLGALRYAAGEQRAASQF